MSFRVFDFINRVLVKSSNINAEFLDRYDTSLAYTVGKLGKIVERLAANEKLCGAKDTKEEDERFEALVLGQKRKNCEMFRSIITEDRPLIVTEEIQGKEMIKFDFPELQKSTEIISLLPATKATNAQGSPSTKSDAQSGVFRFPEEVKASHQNDSQELMQEISDRFHYKDHSPPENWKFRHVAGTFIPNKSIEDFFNVIVLERPIKYQGRTFPSYRDLHLHTQKEAKVKETPFDPPIKTHEKGVGKSTSTASTDKDMPLPIPMAKSVNRMNVEYHHFTLSVNHVIQVMKTQSDDIPCGTEVDIYVVIDV